MVYAIRLYRLMNILSLDVVAGAIVSALFFTTIFSVDTPVYELIALALTVWIIYTTDHLADAKRIKHVASTERHRFHQQHFNTMLVILIVALLMDIGSILFINREVLRWGVVLVGIMAAFLIVQQWVPWIKELCIGSFYTCGVLLPSITFIQRSLSTAHYLIILQFALVAISNLLLFSWLDRDTDRKDGLDSFLTMFGEKVTRACIWILTVIQLVLMTAGLIIGESIVPTLMVSAMGLCLFGILMSGNTASNRYVSRLIGDAIFLIPVFYLLL